MRPLLEYTFGEVAWAVTFALLVGFAVGAGL